MVVFISALSLSAVSFIMLALNNLTRNFIILCESVLVLCRLLVVFCFVQTLIFCSIFS